MKNKSLIGCRKVSVEHSDYDRAFAHSRCDPFDRSCTYVADGKHSGNRSCIGSVVSTSLATCENKSVTIESNGRTYEFCSRFCSDHDEKIVCGQSRVSFGVYGFQRDASDVLVTMNGTTSVLRCSVIFFD
jgi:hypothetical protein